MLNMEENKQKWTPFNLNTRYLVSDLGNVYDTVKCKIKNSHDNGLGYRNVSLMSNNKSKVYYIHRLVAMTYIPTNNIHLEVNHIDGNKANNNVNNLEWISHSDNIKHSFKVGRKPNNGMKNRLHNSDTRLKMSESAKKRWITNPRKTIRKKRGVWLANIDEIDTIIKGQKHFFEINELRRRISAI